MAAKDGEPTAVTAAAAAATEPAATIPPPHHPWDAAAASAAGVEVVAAPRQPYRKNKAQRRRKRARRAARTQLRPQVEAILPELRTLTVAGEPRAVAEASAGGGTCGCGAIAWDSLPAELNPLAGKVPPARAEKKRRQIEGLLEWAQALLPPPPPSGSGAAGPGPTAVDFCAGGGHLGLVLAALRPDVSVVLLDAKQQALDGAARRAAALGLPNIRTVCCSVGDFHEPFDLALALHSCGGAADAVQAAALAARASFVIAPCCYGFVQDAVQTAAEEAEGAAAEAGSGTATRDAKLVLVSGLQYPRSAAYRSCAALSGALYAAIAGSADATYNATDARQQTHDLHARACMNAIDADRAMLAVEAGYVAAVTTMGAGRSEPEREGAVEVTQTGVKNQLLLGCPLRPSSGGERTGSE